MKAVQYFGTQDVKVVEMPVPEAGPGEVLVRVRACGLCATDVKTYVRGHPLIPPGSVLGHEVSGVIARVGGGVEDWQEGDRVAIAPYVPCGECHQCRRGHYTLCPSLYLAMLEPGGFAEFVKVPPVIVRDGLLRVPDHLSLDDATLSEPLGCAYHGFEAMDVQPEGSLLIVGDGPMGLLQVEIGRALGFSPIILSGMTPERLARAAKTADLVVDVRTEDLGARLQEVVGPDGVDVIIVSVGSPSVVESGLSHLGPGGTLNVFAGMPSGTSIPVDLYALHYKEQRILGTFGLAPHHFKWALEALGKRDIDVSGIITRKVSLNGVRDAMEASTHYEGIKTVVVME